MRCRDVIRALAVPTDGLDRAELAQHVATCPRCGRWSARAERFDRLWAATRPAEPSAAAWDAVWSGVCEALDEPKVIPVPASAWSRRRWAIAIVGLAQAAAILVAITLVLHQARPKPAPDRPIQIAQSPPQPIEIEEGEPVIISLSSLTPKPLPQVRDPNDTVALDLVIYGYIEALANNNNN
jgi:hypothetical protein